MLSNDEMKRKVSFYFVDVRLFQHEIVDTDGIRFQGRRDDRISNQRQVGIVLDKKVDGRRMSIRNGVEDGRLAVRVETVDFDSFVEQITTDHVVAGHAGGVQRFVLGVLTTHASDQRYVEGLFEPVEHMDVALKGSQQAQGQTARIGRSRGQCGQSTPNLGWKVFLFRISFVFD